MMRSTRPRYLRRDQLVDGGVDGRVLAADAEAGEEAEEEEPPGGEGERGHRGRGQIDREGDQEELLAAEPVGEPAEEQRARAGARPRRGRRPRPVTWRVGDRQSAAVLGQPAGDVADDGDLEAVQDPDGAEADHDHPVPARPGQPVEPRRDSVVTVPRARAPLWLMLCLLAGGGALGAADAPTPCTRGPKETNGASAVRRKGRTDRWAAPGYAGPARRAGLSSSWPGPPPAPPSPRCAPAPRSPRPRAPRPPRTAARWRAAVSTPQRPVPSWA